jgi:hypothetical protein
MVTIPVAFLALTLLAAASEPPGLQLFNTAVLGQSTSTPVSLLVAKQANDAEPHVVWTDVSCGHYVAASAFYRKPVTLELARAALNRAFSRFEMSGSPTMLMWRVDDPAIVPGGKTGEVLAVQLTMADDETVRVIYILGRKTTCPSHEGAQ